MADTGPPAPDPQDQVRLAMAAAQAAYQDSSRLIRLLTVLSRQVPADRLLDDAITTIATAFQADLACLAQVSGGRLLVTAACGLPEDDPAFTAGWLPSPQALQAIAQGRPLAALLEPESPAEGCREAGPGGCELAAARALGLRSGVWLPLPDDGRVGHVLALYRSGQALLTGTEVALLASVVDRLQVAVQARHRATALELLARSGPALAGHSEPGPLLLCAADLLRELVGAPAAAVYELAGGYARLTSLTAEPGGAPPDRPPREVPQAALPGATAIAAGRPCLVRPGDDDRGALPADDGGTLLVVPVGPAGAPAAVLFARWPHLPPLMSPVAETAAVLVTNLTAAVANTTLYRALSESEASLRMITDSISDLVAVVDDACRVRYASASYERAVAHTRDELVGRSLLDLVDPDDRRYVRDAVLAAVGTTTTATIEYRFRTGEGSSLWVESVVRPASAQDRTVVMSTRLVEERRRREEALRHQAAHDPLTGLANRAAVTARLDEHLAADRPGDVGVLFCDLDRFKPVNDRLGHAAGDELLRQVAARLRRCTRAGDLIGRLGGDEFVFVLDGVTSREEIAEVGRRVVDALAVPFDLAGGRVGISVSVGAALGARGRTSSAVLLRAADAEMYARKHRPEPLLRTDVARVG